MEVLWLKAHGLSHAEISRLAGVNGNTLVSYLHQYEQEGIEGLKQLNFLRPTQPLAPVPSPDQSPPADAPPATIKEACAQIAALTGIRRSPTQVSFFLKEHCGMKRLKTGVLSAKVDPLKQAEFKNSPGTQARRSRERKACQRKAEMSPFSFASCYKTVVTSPSRAGLLTGMCRHGWFDAGLCPVLRLMIA